jgi:hypothetical protein
VPASIHDDDDDTHTHTHTRGAPTGVKRDAIDRSIALSIDDFSA